MGIVDAKDDQDKWYEAVIRNVISTGNPRNRMLFVHYIGWSTKWDELIHSGEALDRIAARGTHTRRPHRPRPRNVYRYPNMWGGPQAFAPPNAPRGPRPIAPSQLPQYRRGYVQNIGPQ